MKTVKLLALVAVASGLFLPARSTFAQGPVTLVPAQSAWRYSDAGLAFGTVFVTRLYDDSAWASGPARLGFGGDGEQTQLQPGHLTYYFRRLIPGTNSAGISNLLVRLKRDDGAVVHLNGIEVFRSNMPTGAVDHLTPAASAASGADETNQFDSPVLTGSILQSGENVLAVSVHQNVAASADLGFDMEVWGNVAMPSSLAVAVPTGWSVIANPFNRGGNTLNDVLPQAPDGAQVFKWNFVTQNYTPSTYDGVQGVWSPNASLSPGEGAWLWNPSAEPIQITFTGQVPAPPGPMNRPSAPGLRFRAPRWPVASTFEEVNGYPPAEGDRVLTYEGVFPSPPAAPTRIFTFRNGEWDPALPLLPPGQAVFVDLVPPSPRITAQPEDQSASVGESVTFETAATGVAPLDYQWFKDGVPIPGATGPTLTLPDAQCEDAGSYTVRVSNSAGAVTSAPATLQVSPCCVWIVCPTNMVVDCSSPTGTVVYYSVWAENSCSPLDLVFFAAHRPVGGFPWAQPRSIAGPMAVVSRTIAVSPSPCGTTVPPPSPRN